MQSSSVKLSKEKNKDDSNSANALILPIVILKDLHKHECLGTIIHGTRVISFHRHPRHYQ